MSADKKHGRTTFDPDDARLTAYVLGELEGEERTEIEGLLAESAEARAFVEGLRETAEELERELAREAVPGLSPEQRERIELGLRSPQPPGSRPTTLQRRRPRWRRPLSLAAAAALIAILGFGAWLSTQRAAGRETPFTYTIFGGGATGSARPPSRAAGGHPALSRSDVGADRELLTLPLPASTRDNLRRLGYVLEQDDSPNLRDPTEAWNTEAYDSIVENPFRLSAHEALSTFSIDVDTASYANVRRFLLREGRLPPPSAVRIEELVNYFRYDDPVPTDGRPFAVATEVASAPWAPAHRLVRIGLRAKEIPALERPASNLVFLIDVSGSMQSPDKLPLLVRSMKMLVEQLDERDRVAIVVYAGASGLVLPPTSCADAWAVMDALDRLEAGGSTHGSAGIQLAYTTAREHFVQGGLNRVILCTDGDFNVGVTDQGSLVRLIEEERKSGVFLSVLGFGTGNLKDSTMEKLADKGNGNYAYIDSLAEARKVLVAEMGGTLLPVAKDVKLQVEFNPAQVQAWRLIGYENRLLAHEDFADDSKDAGEIGAGLAVTALYEIVPHGVPLPASVADASVDPLRYQRPTEVSGQAFSGELMFLKLRHKPVDADQSLLIETPVRDGGGTWYEATDDFKLASGVALFGMLLRHSEHAGQGAWPLVRQLVLESQGEDPHGYRGELLRMVDAATRIRAELGEALRQLGYGEDR